MVSTALGFLSMQVADSAPRDMILDGMLAGPGEKVEDGAPSTYPARMLATAPLTLARRPRRLTRDE